MANFTDMVFDVTSDTPQLTIYSLSASNNSVIMDTITGTFTNSTVMAVNGILFNNILSAAAATVSLSAVNGVQFRVAPDYHGSQMALYLSDRSSVLFTCNTAVATQTLASAASTNIGPNERRLRVLEII